MATSTQAETRTVLGETVRIRPLSLRDVPESLRAGLDDFRAMPSHYVVVAVIYPVIGVVLFNAVYGANLFALLFPLVAGFALVGPVAAIPFLMLSRRRERTGEARLSDLMEAGRGPAWPGILAVALLIAAIYGGWLVAAEAIYQQTLGRLGPPDAAAFLSLLFTTAEGWTMILIGHAAGAVFALLAMAVSVFSLPLLIDGARQPVQAVAASVTACARNPLTMLAWGAVVAIILAVAALPALIGLAVALPVLAHATWHLYRRAIADGPG